MRLTLFLLCLLLRLISNAQQTAPTSNLPLGYQEFPTTITSHTSDAGGNQYYTGIFRGQLTVNNQAVATGAGLEDIFWVKTNATGQLLRYKTFGSENSEGSYANSLAMGGNNRMLFGINTFETLALGSTTLLPYPSPNGNGNGFATALVCADTAGTILWNKRTTLQNFKIYYSNNVYHVFGNVFPTFSAIKYGDSTVVDSIGKAAIVHLMIDEAGNLLGTKTIAARKSGQGIALANVSFFSDNTLFLQLRADGDTSIQVNNTVLPLPSTFSSYHIFVRTDTSYIGIKSKLLNPLRHTIAGIGNQFLPACVGPGDSVYTVFNYENTTIPFSLDGFSQSPLRNTLYAMDASLTVRRQVFLASSLAGSYATNMYRRRIYFRHLAFQNGQLFLNGMFTGINESPLTAISTKDTTLAFLPGLNITVNQNGPSKSFMARCDINGSNGIMTWYGDHTQYENINVAPAFLHPAGPGRLAFTQTADNVWNPWTLDENLNVITGAMRKGVDLPETPQMIQYFADGSRVVIGYARGKTALDGNNSFVTNNARKDVFIVRLRANNQVAWYKRFHSTLPGSEIRGLEINNGKAYFLANYFGSQNDSNYIQVGADLYNVRVNASLLASIDTAGNLIVLNLPNPVLRTVFLMNFSFFSNGDLAVATDVNPVAYQSFPTSFGPQVFRLNASTGAILDGRKLTGTSSMAVYTIRIDKTDRLYLSGSTGNIGVYKMYLHNGTSFVDSIQVGANITVQQTLLKMDCNRFLWLKKISGNAFVRQNGDMTLSNDKAVLSVLSPAVVQPLFWDGQQVHSGFTTQAFSLIRLNDDGSMAQKKTMLNISPNYTRAGTGGRIYLSGVLRPALQVDTIQLGYAGGIVDGIALVFDSTLTAKKSFRVGSLYSESMWDMDIYQDSIVALAYTGQTSPLVYLNRTMVAAGDFEEDAYVGTLTTRANIITGINNPLPLLHQLSVTPNPVTGCTVHLSAQVTEPLRSVCTVYQSNGLLVSSASLLLSPGINRYSVSLPPTVSKGVYYVIVSNKKWTTTRNFLVQ